MTMTQDETGLPALQGEGDSPATFIGPALDAAALTALTIRALQRHAAFISDSGAARLVSVSSDITGTDFSGGEGKITLKVDRQTRTLLFIGAVLTSTAGLHLRATAIFRLDAGTN